MPRKSFKRRYRSGRPFIDKEMERKKMLDEGRLEHFKYDLRDVLAKSDSVDEEHVRALAQTLVAKASRASVPETKQYVSEKVIEGVVDEGDRDAINRLLDRYSKYR